MKSVGVAIQMKVTEKCFPMVLFTMLYNVVRIVYETPKLDNADESCSTIIFCGTVYYVVHELLFILWIKKARQFKRDLFSRAILLCCM